MSYSINPCLCNLVGIYEGPIAVRGECTMKEGARDGSTGNIHFSATGTTQVNVWLIIRPFNVFYHALSFINSSLPLLLMRFLVWTVLAIPVLSNAAPMDDTRLPSRQTDSDAPQSSPCQRWKYHGAHLTYRLSRLRPCCGSRRQRLDAFGSSTATDLPSVPTLLSARIEPDVTAGSSS